MHAYIHTLLCPALPACAIRQIPKSPPDYTGLFLIGIVFFFFLILCYDVSLFSLVLAF